MAKRYPELWMDELRTRADIVQIVSSYVPLKKNGNRYWGLCPFHNEKTASFSVDAENQLYYCFGCKAGGSVIQFVMDIERLDFRDAVELLADRVHMTVPELEEDPEYLKRKSQRERLLAANREAALYYHQLLFSDEGRDSLQYLKERGLSDSVIRKFGLGAAPDQWDHMTRHLLSKGFTEEELRLSGLTVVHEAEAGTGSVPGKPKRVFDMFRDRAMFPIIDQYGNVLAFGGRAIHNQQPKYLNTSDTPVFNKRLGVYAANLLRKERHLERVILVEGYMDVVALTQFNIPGVCATLGTALTNEQARLLKRFAPKVYLAYDGDSAGQHAILRGLEILEAEKIPSKVLDFPDGLDPDEYIRRDGAEGFASLPVISPAAYRLRRLKEQFDLSSQDGRIEYARASAAIINSTDPVERENLLKELSVQTGFEKDVLLEQANQTKPRPESKRNSTNQIASSPSANKRILKDLDEETKAQEIILSLIATRRLPSDIVSVEDFQDSLLKLIYADLSSGKSPASILDETEDELSRTRISRILLSPQTEDTDQMLKMAKECISTMRRLHLTEQIKIISQRINTLDGPEKNEAIQKYMSLNAELQRLKSTSSAL